MNLRCLAYKALDLSRRTILRPLYSGTIEIRPDVRARGTVQVGPSPEPDGDCTFAILIDDPDARGPFRHCEVTPCDPDSVRALAKTLQPGDRVDIFGDERYDPHHLFDGDGPTGAPAGKGWWELHGIHNLKKL